MTSFSKPLLPLLLLALSQTSCSLGPDFMGAKAPELPATWVNAMPPASKDGDLARWWQQFGDTQLNKLLETAFTNSPDMINAALAISQAEAGLRSTRSSLFPSLSGSAGGTNQGSYDTSTSHGRWTGGLSASWTPDIWGATRREVEASFASLGSTKAAADATRTALASQIASVYFQWITAKENLRIAREQLEYQERTYNIVARQNAVGMNAKLDLEGARATIASTRASIPRYEANIRSYESNLALLMGTTVDKVTLVMPRPSVYNKIPRVPTNLPADLLRRRPDIIRAENQLHAATARIGVSVANLFPRISLTGSTSAGASTDFSNFFSSAGWSLGASVSQTLLNRTALNESVNIAELQQMSAAQDYRKTVLAAFAEVEASLITYAQLIRQLPEQVKIRDAHKKAAELSLSLYEVGHTDFLNVSSSERAWLSSELTLVTTRQQIRIELAKLSTAMGGGYEVKEK